MLTKFASSIRRLPPGSLTLADIRTESLRIFEDDRLAMYYAPFDHVNEAARIAIVGVTPGPTQMTAALETVRDGLLAGESTEQILERVKQQASFKGMRRDLAGWLDSIGLHPAIGLDTCADLFHGAQHAVHTTSAVRYPTFQRQASGEWKNWSGHGLGPLDHPLLQRAIDGLLAPELAALPDAVIVPLDRANVAIEHLCSIGQLDPRRCVIGLPHPSGVSARRHEYFNRAAAGLRRQVSTLRRHGGAAPRRPASATPARRAPRPARAHKSRHSPSEARNRVSGRSITIALTQGNLNSSHIYLRAHLDFFPDDAVGPANSRDGLGVPLTVSFAGLTESSETDIAGGNKLFFRSRAPVRAFLALHRLREGDAVRIERHGTREYEVFPVRRA